MSTSRPEVSTREADLGEADLGEADLIDRWLDEGDWLAENARATVASAPVEKKRRLAFVLGAVAVLAIVVGVVWGLSRAVRNTPQPEAQTPIPAPAAKAPAAPPPTVAAAAPIPAPEPQPAAT